MKLKLHHINLSTNNVAGMDYFYRNVLGLEAETDGLPVLEKNKGYGTEIHRTNLIKEGATKLHRKSFISRLEIN